MVIADRLGILVNQVYGDPESYGGGALIVATIAFAFQIYCDFSGYSDIAIGLARTMGFDLMKNFDAPYLSNSITSFWRRWHISLSTWFKDYVYIPLGGSRKGSGRTYLNLFLVFVISGLWHGAALNFIIWGSIHGIFIVLEKAVSRNSKQSKIHLSSRIFKGVFTFVIVCFAWIFFRSNSFADSVFIVSNLFNFGDSFNFYDLGLPKHEFLLALLLIIILILFDTIHRRYNAFKLLHKTNFVIRGGFYALIILSIILFGVYGDDSVSEFIYFQF